MDQDNKNATGAPSDDTTSALFVSARKKQLEQQEAERRAREKEEQRLAAEAEVQRLEREVAERRRKAEEDSKRVEAETAEDARRIAEESRARKAQAAENPDAVLGAQTEKKEFKLPQMPKIALHSKTAKPSDSAPSSGVEAAAKAPLNIKMLAIIGGGVAVVALVIVLIVTMGGKEVGLDQHYINSRKGFDFMYPSGWIVDDDFEYAVSLYNEAMDGTLLFFDASNTIYTMMNQGHDIISATESVFDSYTARLFGIDQSLVPPPQLQKVGDYVVGGVMFEANGYSLTFDIEAIEGRMIGFVSQVAAKNQPQFDEIAGEIRFSLAVSPSDGTSGTGGTSGAGSGTGAIGQEDGEPWDIDPDSPLDAVVELEALRMGVPYPSETFYVESSGDDFIQLATHDPNGAALRIQQFSEVALQGGKLYSNDISPVINGIGKNVLDNFSSTRENFSLEHEYEMPLDTSVPSEFCHEAAGTYTTNGMEMACLMRTGIWFVVEDGASTDKAYYFTMILFCNSLEKEDYADIFWQMREASFDA